MILEAETLHLSPTICVAQMDPKVGFQDLEYGEAVGFADQVLFHDHHSQGCSGHSSPRVMLSLSYPNRSTHSLRADFALLANVMHEWTLLVGSFMIE